MTSTAQGDVRVTDLWSEHFALERRRIPHIFMVADQIGLDRVLFGRWTVWAYDGFKARNFVGCRSQKQALRKGRRSIRRGYKQAMAHKPQIVLVDPEARS